MIYSIRSKQTTKVYYGKTSQTLSRRMAVHRCRYRNYEKPPDYYCSSFEILQFDDADIFEEEDSNENRVEGLYQKNDENSVNIYISGRTSQEYYEDNKEKKLKYQKEYYQQNKEDLSKYFKEYAKKNKDKIKKRLKEIVECPICKTSVQKGNLSHHKSRSKFCISRQNSS